MPRKKQKEKCPDTKDKGLESLTNKNIRRRQGDA